MKKILSVLLAILFLSLCGCDFVIPYTGNDTETESSKITVEEPTSDSLDDYEEESSVFEETSSISGTVASSSYDAVSSSKEETTLDNETTYAKSTTESSVVSNTTSSNVYYANTNTNKFHYSTCGSAKLIKEANLYTTSSREELINSGYSPCLRCNP